MTAAALAVAPPTDDYKVPLRRLPKLKTSTPSTATRPSSPPKSSLGMPKCAAPAPPIAAKRRRGGIQAYMAPTVTSCPTPNALASAPTVPQGTSTPTSTGVASIMGIDVARFNTLLDQVKRLTQALSEQAQTNAQLKEQLQAAPADSADIRLRLRSAASKRARSADATVAHTSHEHYVGEAAISSAEDDPVAHRRTTWRKGPHNA